jgi:CheY-like chemotaxis protein
MTPDESIRLVVAIGGVLGVIVWPALILFVVVRFRASLSDFFSHLGEFSFKAPGLEATARRQQVEAAAALGAAMATQASVDDGPGSVTSLSGVADALREAVPDARSQSRLQGRLVLWVDDRPDNNQYERRALEALGVRFVLSTSTDDALEKLRHQSFDLIISDMGRAPDSRAGYTLLDKLRADRDRTPFVIYAGSNSPESAVEARRRGAIGWTNSPQELIRMVTQALK